ncbi:MAG: CDP-alcohol phosphatidyltransferase family protein [Prevotellaceae bacterium]|jgi:phosphatidylglycerophosphate synthase|nr:CDP-alcohol phosphatidyltransferase family protein [Prevotellaceae bacterium]
MTSESTQKPNFEASLKSIEIENFFDRVFYRPVGYQIALLLRNTGITPNFVTIVSIFFGVAAGWFFYPENIWQNLAGIGLLIFANILDCVDGQLARLTGIKSETGRILDGLAGDLWFVSIYSFLAMRLAVHLDSEYAWTLAALAGASNLVQANITDYYKTLHLYFISLKTGAEFDTVEKVKQRLNLMKGINRLQYRLYLYYTVLQTKLTPQLQRLLQCLYSKYGEDFPPEIRKQLRAKSLKIIPNINLITFNWRSIVLFISLIAGQVWIYLLWEIIVLNIVMVVAIGRHEAMCKEFRLTIKE